jgi:hypothetical protein
MRTLRLYDVRLHPICEEYSGILGPHIRTLHEARAKEYKVDNSNGAA